MRFLFSIIVVLFFSLEVRAQILPPDFQCVRNDSLIWELPINSCGAFIAYDIYISTNENGPYTLLTSINNPSIGTYFHNNPSGETFYFYLQTNADCPGEPILQSDTLDNNQPIFSPITNVSVSNNQVEINWLSSTSDEVTNYIIYRTTPIGSLPLDTVDASQNTYIDLTANPQGKIESYFILAMDICGNTSIFDLPHFTIFLQSDYTPCGRSIHLNWNKYRNWLNGIEKQQIWISTNNSSFSLLTELSNSDSSYVFTETNDGDSYCFFIKATEHITGLESISNTHCLNLDIFEPVRTLFLKNVSVNNDNLVELTWLWNDDAEVNEVEFLERAKNESFNTLSSYTLPAIIDTETTQVANGSDPTPDQRFYQVKSIDDCDSLRYSNEVASIHLLGLARNNQTNQLSWTPFDRVEGTIENYDIYRIVDGISSYVETVDGTTTLFSDPVDISNPAEANICYYVIANASIVLPDGSEMSIASQSNTICVNQLSDILAPNAFVPEGFNKEFKPRIVFIEETIDYNMQIFDRWGKKVFESDNASQGWTGNNGHFYYPAGVYVYIIRITQISGRVVEKRGTLALIR